MLINKKKKTCHIVYFTVSVENSENKRKQKDWQILNLARELKKKQRNMNVTVIPIVFGALGTVFKVLEKRREDLKIRGRLETIQTTALLRLAKNTEKNDLLSFSLQWKTTS